MKILDLLVRIAPVAQGVKDGYKVSRETEKVLSVVDKTLDSGTLTAVDTQSEGRELVD